jgi:excisionase family DNA binding protein
MSTPSRLEPLAVSITEAGRMLALSPYTISYYIRHGKIRSVRFGRRVSIPIAEVERLSREGIPSQPPLHSESEVMR